LVHPYLRATMKKNNRRLIIFLGGILFFFFGQGANPSSLWAKAVQKSPTARLIQIEDQVLEDRIRVTLITDQPVVYRSFTMTNPSRLVLDLKPCVLDPQKTFTVKDPSIAGVRFSQFNSKTVRIVFDFSQPPVFQVSHKKGNPFQIFVDLPMVKPPMTQPVFKKIEEKYLTQTTIEEFKEEKTFQNIRLKEEKAHSQKPLVTFDFYMTNLHNVLRLIGEIGGVNILVGDEVKEKKLTMSLKEVPWDEALNSILDANNLKKLLRGEKTILVTTNENYKKITDDENKVRFDAIKIEQEELKAEEQRQKVGKITWEKRQFQIKNVDVKLVEDLIQGSIEKEKKIATDRGLGNQLGSQQTTVTETFKVSGANVHIMSVPHTNTLIARGTERELNYIEDLIKTIDQPVSQVMIEARIVEADASFTRDLGLQWGGGFSFANTHAPFAGTVQGGTGVTGKNYAVNLPLATTSTAFGGLGFSFASANFNIDVRIQAMEQQGRGKTISSPKVLTLDNTKAVIKQGQSIPVTTRDQNNSFSTIYRDAALILTVTPHISSGKKIRITVKVEKNEPDFTKVDTLGNPTINIKEAETEMMVNDGDTVAIGGILYKKETFQENKVPGLGEIPIVGWLFKTRYRTTDDKEMLIFLTPKIQKSSLPNRFGNDS
jgi:type IV pilus assembly protein PilQ